MIQTYSIFSKRMMFRTAAVSIFVLAAAGFLPLFGASQDAGPRSFDLDSARAFAVAHSFDTRRSRIDLESARQKLKETVASGLPQINSGLSYNNNLKLATSLIPNFFEGKFDEKIPVQFGTQHNAAANLQVQQLVFSGSYFVGLQASQIFRQLAEQGVERTELNVRETVSSTYTLILVARENTRILASSLSNLDKTAAEVRELYNEGFVAETDVDLLQIALIRLRNGLQTVEKQSEIAEKLLKFQMGLDLDEGIVLTESLESLLDQADIEDSMERPFALDQSIDYRILTTQERLSEMALKNERTRYWPTVAAFFTYQQNAFRDTFNFFTAGQRWFPLQVMGLSISLPLFKSGGQQAKVAQAALTLEQARTGREQAARGILLEAEQTKIRLSSARENHLAMKANLDLTQKVYEATLAKYKEGVASSMELTQAHDKHLEAQSGYIQALSELLNAKNRLDRITRNYGTESKG